MASIYDPLRDYLHKEAQCGRKTVVLTFNDIERILGDSLTDSARTDWVKNRGHREWWANENVKKTTHPQSEAWQNAGYKVNGKKSDFNNGTICFEM